MKDSFEGLTHIRCHRDTIVDDILAIYDNESVCMTNLSVKIQGEEAIDFGGVTAEVFELFWEKIFEMYFDGEDMKVPFVSPHKMANARRVFSIIGRVLSHAFILTGTIPVQFCQASLLSIFLEAEKIPNAVFEFSILGYVTSWEREELEKAMNNPQLPLSSLCSDLLFSIFTRFGMAVRPLRGLELKKQLITMAKSQFVYKAGCFLQWIREGIPQHHYDVLWNKITVDQFMKLYDDLKPTREKVLLKLQTPEDVTPAQETVLYFLKSYIANAESEKLERLLRYITGATTVPREAIKVSFHAAVGLLRLPGATTCSNVLCLSTSYETYRDFRKAIYALLSDDNAFVMHRL